MELNIAEVEGKIQGVELRKQKAFADNRGVFTEIFRSGWPRHAKYGAEIQVNLSRSVMGALRGLHYHKKQSDWWVPISGTFQIALADLRKESVSFLTTAVFQLGCSDNRGLLIPPGVAHGFLALTDVTLIYVVNSFYDGTDEQAVAWNDPDLGIEWKSKTPILSERDKNNPTVAQLLKKGLMP